MVEKEIKMKLFKNKKGQIATTLTWIVATAIIFFILFIYLILSGSLAFKKSIFTGKNKITLEKISHENEVQRQLFYLLESPFNDNYDFKDAIIYWALTKNETFLSELKENSKKILEENPNDCNFLLIRMGNSDNIFYLNEKFITSRKDLISNEIFIPINDNKLNIQLHSKKC